MIEVYIPGTNFHIVLPFEFGKYICKRCTLETTLVIDPGGAICFRPFHGHNSAVYGKEGGAGRQFQDFIASLVGIGMMKVLERTSDGGHTVKWLWRRDGGATVETVLLYHVVDGVVPSTALSDGQVVPTLQGGTLTVDLDAGVRIVGSSNAVDVVLADVPAANGVIHVIDAVLLPPSN